MSRLASKKKLEGNLSPVGWRLILRPRIMEEKTQGGLIIPDSVRDVEQYGEIVLEVLDVGPLAYKEDRFMGEPWVKKGDWVVIARHAGWRITTSDEEYRVVNDDEIIAVVSDPDFLR